MNMFFVKQQSNQCGLHAIQNLFKSAAVTRDDLHEACQTIHKTTGDAVRNHESFGGDWSVEAVTQAMHNRGYTVERGVKSNRLERAWALDDMDSMVQDPLFRGFLIHQPINHHFTCIRPEKVGDDTHLYYVDSQATGPIRISARLAMRRCLASAYAWEPFAIKGPEMDYVEPVETPVSVYEGLVEDKACKRFKPSAEFFREWENLASPKSGREETTLVQSNPALGGVVHGDKPGM